MRLILHIPDDWSRTATAGGQLSRRDEQTAIFTSPLEPLPPLGLPEWSRRRIAMSAPPGLELRIDEERATRSSAGWPVVIFACTLHAGDGSLVEHRVVVLYRFIYHAGIAELRSSHKPSDADAPLFRLLLDGAPDFSGEIACLADILGDVPA